MNDNENRLDDIAVRISQAAAVKRGTPYTAYEKASAASLLDELLKAAAKHGVTFEYFDGSIDLPRTCLELIRRKIEERGGVEGNTA